MKRIATIAAFILLWVTGATAQSTTKEIYEMFSDKDDVSAVYISSNMFKLIGRIPSMELGDADMDLSPIITQLTSLYVIDCENGNVITPMKAAVSQLVEKKKYELLMEMKDSNEKVRIYTLGDEKTVSSFLMTASDGDNGFTLIALEGKMKRQDLENTIAECAKDIDINPQP